MLRFNHIKDAPPDQFVRDVGIPIEKFLYILEKLEKYIEEQKEKNPLKRRGRKSTKGLTLADKLLLTLYYMRHYHIFFKLGQLFDLSEGYANKIYHYVLGILPEILDMPNPKELLNPEVTAVAIDVTEQPVERPEKNQKEYYSGKKKDIL